MLRKILVYLGSVLFFVALSRCNKCTRKPIENTTDWTLTWEPAKLSPNLLPNNLDVEKGLSVYVPSDNVAYYINPTGECWKFIQASGRLSCASINSVPGSLPAKSLFAFSAGTTKGTQALHVGIVTETEIILHKYSAGSWQMIGTFSFSDLGISSSPGISINVAACSLLKEGEKTDCLIALHLDASPSNLLLYDVETQKLLASEAWKYEYPDRTPIALAQLARKELFLLYKEGTNKFKASTLHEGEGVPYLTPVDSQAERTNLCLIEAPQFPLRKFCLVLYQKDDAKGSSVIKPSFYTFTKRSEGQANELPGTLKESKKGDSSTKEKANMPIAPKEEPPVDDHTKSFLLPFGNRAYFITKNSKGECVYYTGFLGPPTKKKT